MIEFLVKPIFEILKRERPTRSALRRRDVREIGKRQLALSPGDPVVGVFDKSHEVQIRLGLLQLPSRPAVKQITERRTNLFRTILAAGKGVMHLIKYIVVRFRLGLPNEFQHQALDVVILREDSCVSIVRLAMLDELLFMRNGIFPLDLVERQSRQIRTLDFLRNPQRHRHRRDRPVPAIRMLLDKAAPGLHHFHDLIL